MATTDLGLKGSNRRSLIAFGLRLIESNSFFSIWKKTPGLSETLANIEFSLSEFAKSIIEEIFPSLV